jgi:hypothetical protein
MVYNKNNILDYKLGNFKESMIIKDNILDLQCDDHKKMYSQDVQADRFCSKCNLVICNNCVIDYHSDHLVQAKNRIEDFLNKQKLEADELKSKVIESIKMANNNNNKLQSENQENLLRNIFQRRITNLELIKMKVEELINEEKNLSAFASDNLKSGVNKELFNKITQKNYELEDCNYILIFNF